MHFGKYIICDIIFMNQGVNAMTLRNERVRKELMRDISEILRKEIRGLKGVVSIVDVEVSHDNSFA